MCIRDSPSTVGVVFETPGEALGNLPAFLFEVHRGHVDEVLFTALLLVWAGLAIARRDPVTDWRGARLEILARVFVVSYFVGPRGDGLADDLPARKRYPTAHLHPPCAGAMPFHRREMLAMPVLLDALAGVEH